MTIALSFAAFPDGLSTFESAALTCAELGLGADAVNVADTVSAAVSVTVQVPVPVHPEPDHPANVDPAAAAADSVMVVPCDALVLQVPGQLIPPPVTEPVPDPLSDTASLS